MNGDSVLDPHFIEFVDADDPPVCQDHGASLELELSGGGVLDDAGRESGCGGAFAGSVYANGGDSFDILEELALGGAGVSDQKYVDIAPELGLVGQQLFAAAEEQTGNGLFDVVVAVDGRADVFADAFVDVLLLGQLQELLLLLLAEQRLELATAQLLVAEAQHLDVGHLQTPRLFLVLNLLNLVNPAQSYSAARLEFSHQMSIATQLESARYFSGRHVVLLKLQDLLVDQPALMTDNLVRVHHTHQLLVPVDISVRQAVPGQLYPVDAGLDLLVECVAAGLAR